MADVITRWITIDKSIIMLQLLKLLIINVNKLKKKRKDKYHYIDMILQHYVTSHGLVLEVTLALTLKYHGPRKPYVKSRKPGSE